ncbi:hypothetical protein DCS_03580 [Drechmeria coniospora]|uniref:Uncharacterized protein n=1 Tax=Drechmeria coniospora TaxID=98403 RepID=A0A151GHN9_DRECN|nr:hypothetical protein DCS_03580 [Drechmeria coniospora]KYK56579.1 hypothetical protein DCS_03580 [Drechmeria coniospora]ODA77019.1 hypothetical protein RJ55_07536 [Drechmeria coniospora]
MKFSVAILFAAVASAGTINRRGVATDTVNDIYNNVYLLRKGIDKGAPTQASVDKFFKDFFARMAVDSKTLQGLPSAERDEASLVQLAHDYPAIGTTIQLAVEGNKALQCYMVQDLLVHTRAVFSNLAAFIHDSVAKVHHEAITSQAADLDEILSDALNGCASSSRSTIRPIQA